MNFFRTAYLLCTRLSGLPQLMGIPLWRTVLHVLLLMIICPLILATVLVKTDKPVRQNTVQLLFAETGGPAFQNGRFVLGSGMPEQHLTFSLMNTAVRFDYVSGKPEKAIPDETWKENVGVIGTPGTIYFWLRIGDLYQILSLDSELAELSFTAVEDRSRKRDLSEEIKKSWSTSLKSTDRESFRQDIRRSSEEKPAGVFDKTKLTIIPAKRLDLLLACYFWLSYFILYFQECLFLVLFSGVVFALVQMLRFRPFPKRLPFKMVFKLMLYCTFPA